ncbi:MAG TPA: hypothetical protein VMF31_07065 [Solirubrobacterales bacterium]|nr:hypothetical protein [Solirubrobacterales bacterium]
MEYELIDKSGVSLETFGTPERAMDAFREMVGEDPAAADDIAILKLDDEGHAIGRIDTEGVASTAGR